MQTEFLGLRTVIYKVPDINQAKRWYSGAFATEPYFDTPFHVGLNIAGYELGLQPGEEGTHSKTGNIEMYWGVKDVEAFYNRLINPGASPNNAPQDVGEGIIVATLKDPWNNIIGLIDNPHFKPD